MLILLFHLIVMVDRLLASRNQRRDAQWHAMYARMRHGDRAIEHLYPLLAEQAQRRARRVLRLAIADLVHTETHERSAPPRRPDGPTALVPQDMALRGEATATTLRQA